MMLNQWLVQAVYQAPCEGDAELTRAHLDKCVLSSVNGSECALMREEEGTP